jgi:hypothetical protein
MNVFHVQFEAAAARVLQNLHQVGEDGAGQEFCVQVLISSSQKFGPASLRDLSVRGVA